MDIHKQQELLGELVELHDTRTPYLDREWVKESMARYQVVDGAIDARGT